MVPDTRFRTVLNLSQFNEVNVPLRVGEVSTFPPERQMILRMLVQSPYSSGLQLPRELSWMAQLIAEAQRFQNDIIHVRHPFTYVTVRSGLVESVTDDEWHVDGFSLRYHHLPEANYVAVIGEDPTEVAEQAFPFPSDFDPLRHNVQSFFQKRVVSSNVRALQSNTLYMVDPYVVHRRPPRSRGKVRCFLRISFTPIEIPDINNTPNPLIETRHYVTDGVRDFRDSLEEY